MSGVGAVLPLTGFLNSGKSFQVPLPPTKDPCMRLEVRSRRHSASEFVPILNRIRQATQFSDLATVVVTDRLDGQVTGGYSIKRPNKQDLYKLKKIGVTLPTAAAPSLITLAVSSDLEYPQASYHVKEVGIVEFLTWEEEVLFVLGHEQAHVDQYWTNPLPAYEAEVDAEKKALLILQEYRANQADEQSSFGGSSSKRDRTLRSRQQ